MLKYQKIIVDLPFKTSHVELVLSSVLCCIMYTQSLLVCLKGQLEGLIIIRNTLLQRRLSGEDPIVQWRVGLILDMEESLMVSFL